jgi:S-DNA-T family DNA segregation ATPase FtsK/SpoIIIE
MAVGGKRIRIEAPIPGKAAVGIELPNDEMQVVHFKSILVSDAFRKAKFKLPIVIGRTVSGAPYISDITKMPHLLIAGQTGSGKSVAINSFLCTMLMTKTPDELRLILIDPKKVEMSYYENIPHLLAPVVTESKEAVKALQWGVGEMTRRYRLLAKVYARNIDSFNQKIEEKSIKEGLIPEADNKKLPFIVIIVDELADLMLTASRDVEGLIQRIAQLARAVGIHLLVATQRPSVDIITGPIKANLTSRIAFRTIQSVDSRTILGHIGAEKLLGRGDMLFLRNGAPDIERYHGSFISEEDVETIVDTVRNQEYDTDKLDNFEDDDSGAREPIPGVPGAEGSGRDEKFEEAARLIVSTGLGSTSLLQRRLKLGYARAGRLMDELHEAGIVGPQEGSKAREVLVTPETLEDVLGS